MSSSPPALSHRQAVQMWKPDALELIVGNVLSGAGGIMNRLLNALRVRQPPQVVDAKGKASTAFGKPHDEGSRISLELVSGNVLRSARCVEDGFSHAPRVWQRPQIVVALRQRLC